MSKEIKNLLADIARIPDDQIEEPDLDVGPLHNVCGKVDDIELRRLFTGYVVRLRELDNLHSLIKGMMLVAGNVPIQIRAKMMELQDEIDLLRICFFYALSKRFDLFGKNYINVHKGWLVSWSNHQMLCAALPNLSGDRDDDDDGSS